MRVAKGDNAMDEAIRKSSHQLDKPPAARFGIAPATLDFPSLDAGGSASRAVEVVNNGDLAAPLMRIHVAGQASAFHIGGDCVDGMEIGPGGHCAVLVTFLPRTAGPANAELVVVLGDAEGTRFVPLSGVGRGALPPPAQPAPNAEASLAFLRSRRSAGLALDGDPPVDPPGGGGVAAPDYTDAGLPGVVSGLPVDRRRVITADRYIPAVLESDIDSLLAGRAIAVVERNVYGADGRLALIPAGSRVIGAYRTNVKNGQARLEVAWSRIFRPDGATINIDDLGADVMGRSGLPGELDSRMVEKYGGSLLTSVVAAAGDWALGGDSTTVLSPFGGTSQSLSGKQRAANRLGNDLDGLGQRMIQDNIDTRPVLMVAAGTRLDIIPSEDIWLQDPRHLRPVTPPKAQSTAARRPDAVADLLPGLIELVAQNPGVARLAPQTTQQVMQSTLLQQLRDGNYSLPRPPAAGGNAP